MEIAIKKKILLYNKKEKKGKIQSLWKFNSHLEK
jgi:hypothetical protein